ncbi:hypothetical protein R0H03_04180 [Pediococcus acidilactici]|uniref:Uncharacterized protein n=1 Tax=Pediococcus acidilactici TaxID=1254 RepID=A0AAW8YNJ4_PEDAC|nr:hypothetical protein [Pediococcus acidilactici]MDV2911064.1 hypothetical protein [Pediococcus acidilactici]WQS17612.1 hypothetical protein SGW14_00825 [Pediococcus acidilactici]
MEDANGEFWLFDVVYNDKDKKSIELRQTLKNMAGRLLQGSIEFGGRHYSNEEAEAVAFKILDIISIFDRMLGIK